jgi:hypothetical protein
MTVLVNRQHPINDGVVGPDVELEMTKHRDGTFSLRVNAEMLSLIQQGLSDGSSLAASFADRPWTTPEFQHARAKRFEVLAVAIQQFHHRNR